MSEFTLHVWNLKNNKKVCYKVSNMVTNYRENNSLMYHNSFSNDSESFHKKNVFRILNIEINNCNYFIGLKMFSIGILSSQFS